MAGSSHASSVLSRFIFEEYTRTSTSMVFQAAGSDPSMCPARSFA